MDLESRKILLITVRADLGGGPFHIDLILKNLVDNFNFYMAAPLDEPYGIQWQQRLGKQNFFELPFRSFSVIRFLKLLFFIKKKSIRLVHSHGKGAGIYSRMLKVFLPGIKVVHTFHGIHLQQYNSFRRNIYIRIERLLSKLTNQFINVSAGEQKICLQNNLFDKNISRIILNAMNPIANPGKTKTEIRRDQSLPLERFIIISVLRFSYQKNLPLLVNIAEQLSENKRILFLIIGDGEQRKEIETVILEKKIDNIIILGFRTNVHDYLFASDIYLSTSLWEGLPYSLIEAASCGLPIVATNVIGNNEIVNDSENGYLFQLNNPEIAVEKILELESLPDLQKQMGKNSMSIADNKFQLASMIEQIEHIYTNLFNQIKT